MAKTSNTFISKHTVIEELNPMTKIFAVFSLGLGSLIFPGSWLGLAVIIGLFVTACLAGILKEFAKIMFGFGVPVAVMLLFIQGCYHPGNVTVIADLGFAKVGLEGVLYALKIISTLLVFLGAFYIMNKTTYPGKLVAALTKSGLPPKAGYLVLASLNVVPQMQRRMAVIQEAPGSKRGRNRRNYICQGKSLHTAVGTSCHVLSDRCSGKGYDAGDQRVWNERRKADELRGSQNNEER